MPGEGEEAQSAAREACLRLLASGPRTRAQLAEALQRRGIPRQTAEAVLERFGEVGLIDDEAFAAAWVESRRVGRGLAPRALASELRRRGVAEDTVQDAVAGIDPEDEVDAARTLVRRRLAATRGKDPVTRMRRLSGMLARKGYSAGLAFRVVKEELEAEGIDVGTDFVDPEMD